MTHIYSKDGTKKVDIDKATLLGDVSRDLEWYQQGDNSQLWKSANGSYFTGCCIDNWRGSGKTPKYTYIVPISNERAKAWVIKYYGPTKLAEFGFADNAEEL